MTPCVYSSLRPGANGYVRKYVGSKNLYLHRLTWERERGPIPEGMTIDHLCLDRACQNVEHMEVVTRAENTRRALARRYAGPLCQNGHPKDINRFVDAGGRTRCRACLAETAARRPTTLAGRAR